MVGEDTLIEKMSSMKLVGSTKLVEVVHLAGVSVYSTLYLALETWDFVYSSLRRSFPEEVLVSAEA